MKIPPHRLGLRPIHLSPQAREKSCGGKVGRPFLSPTTWGEVAREAGR